jgi:copper oxidase (laccase) domain-containing protein
VSGEPQSAIWEASKQIDGVEVFPPLRQLGVRHGFIVRHPDLPMDLDRASALEALRPYHAHALAHALPPQTQFHTAEQIHGAGVAIAQGRARVHAGADALITADPSVCLGIYTADCCAVFLWDPEARAAGLVHSGAKGTVQAIVPRTILAMREAFACEPGRMIAVLSPCIRPPLYEVDFAAQIFRQCEDAGVSEVRDGGECTGRELPRYYSYRMERGRTGRMLAFLAV